jgi:hypothetical protein
MVPARDVDIQHDQHQHQQHQHQQQQQQQQQQLKMTDAWQLGWCIIHCGCMVRAVTYSVV